MKLVLIPDKFKGSLSAGGVREAIAEGVLQEYPGARFRGFAASDGGDGFLDAVRAARDAVAVEVATSDPLNRKIRAPYLWDGQRQEAYVEMALASGMVLLSEEERNPLCTTTRGTGRLIRAALDRGARTVFVGLGGSATTDGGTGIAAEFGYRFLDAQGVELPCTGGSLIRISRIAAPPQVLPSGARVVAVNDVSNPLWGPQGAAFVYAPQKGADAGAVEALDRGLRHLDRLVEQQLGVSASEEPGSGAAGGTAYGLKAFLGGQFMGGTEFVFRLNGVAEYLRAEPADLIVTGEGRIDSQSLQGKLIQGVIRLGREHGIPVVAVCGSCTADRETLRASGLRAVIEVADPEKPLAWNMENASGLIRDAVSRYFAENPIIGS